MLGQFLDKTNGKKVWKKELSTTGEEFGGGGGTNASRHHCLELPLPSKVKIAKRMSGGRRTRGRKNTRSLLFAMEFDTRE